MRMAGQKRKRHRSSSDSPSTATSCLTASQLADVANTSSTRKRGNSQNYRENPSVSERRVGDQHPHQLHIRRSNLQRGAKDKVYAERLAAAGDSVSGLNREFDIQRHKAVARDSDLSASFTFEDGRHGDQFYNATSNPGNASSNGVQKDASKSHSKNISRNINALKDSRSKQTLTGRRREETPLGWPFTDPTILSGRKSSPKSSESAQQSQNKSITSKSSPSLKEGEFLETQNGSTVLTKRQQEDSSSGSSETSHQSGNASRHDKRREFSSSSSSDVTTKKAKIKNNSVSSSGNITSKTHIECTTFESDTKLAKPTKPSPSSNQKKVSYWTCNRCTLANSNRRKKCEVCGNIRNLSMSSDGTFVLTDESDELVKKPRVDLICGSLSNNGFEPADFQSDPLRESNARSNYTISETMFSLPNASQTEAQTPRFDCLSSMASPTPPDTLTQTNDIFAIVSEPVSTRSRFKRLRLSQGMTQQKDEENHTQQSSSPSTLKHLESQAAHDIRRLHTQHNRNENHDPNTSGFREWITKRRNARREKRHAKYSKNKARDYGDIREINVRLTLDENGSSEKSSSNSIILFAVVSSSLLSRIRCSDDVDRGGRSRGVASFRPSIHKDYAPSIVENDAQVMKINVHQPQLFYRRDHFDESTRDKVIDNNNPLKGEINLVRVQIYCSGQRFNKGRLWARIPIVYFSSGRTSSSQPDSQILLEHEACNSSEATNAMTENYTSKQSEHDSIVKVEGGDGAKSDCSFAIASSDVNAIFTCVDDNDQCDSLVISETHKKFDSTGCGDHDETKSLCSNDCDHTPRESCHNQHPDGTSTEKPKLLAKVEKSQNVNEKAGGIDNRDEKQVGQSIHAIYRDEGIDPKSGLDKTKGIEAARNNSTFRNSQDTMKHAILLDSGPEESELCSRERALSPIASIECGADHVVVNTNDVNFQQPQWHSYPPHVSEDNFIDAGREQAKSRHAGTTKEITAFISHTSMNGSASLGSHKDDIFKRNPNIGSSCVKSLLGNQLQEGRPTTKISRTKNEPTSDAVTILETNIHLSNAKECASYKHDDLLKKAPSDFGNVDTNPHLTNEKGQKETKNVETFDRASIQSCPLFQTAGKKGAINVTAESLSKANTLFSLDLYENVSLYNVSPVSGFPAAMNNAQGKNTEKQQASLTSKSSDPISNHSFPMFQTAGKKVTIDVTAESLSKANTLFSHDFYENVSLYNVSPVSGFPAAMNNAQGKNTEKQQASLTSKSSDPISSHSFPMFQTAGKKVTIDVTAESLSKANTLFSHDFYENVSLYNASPVSGFPAAMNNAQGKNTEKQQASLTSKSSDPISNHSFPMFQTAGKKVTIDVTAESLSKANTLFSHDFYENVSLYNVSPVSGFPAAMNNAQGKNTEKQQASLTSKSSDPISSHSFPMFQTAGKKVTIDVTAESLSKANTLFSHDFYENVSLYNASPVSGFPAAMNNAQGKNTEKQQASLTSKSSDPISSHSFPMFQTAGKKVPINVTAESLSKANTLFSRDFYENASLRNVATVSAFPATINNAQGENTEKQQASLTAKSSDPISNHSFPMFQTAGKKVPINVTAESLSKANTLFSHEFYENASSRSVPPASAFPAAMNNAQGVNTENQQASDNSKSIDPISSHSFPMFQTAGKKVAVKVTAESLSKANKLFSNEVESRTLTQEPSMTGAEFLEEGTAISHRVATRRPTPFRNDVSRNPGFPFCSEMKDQLTTHNDIFQKDNEKHDACMVEDGSRYSMSQTLWGGSSACSDECLHRKKESPEAKNPGEHATVILSSDISTLKQSTRRLRHSNRVRFSLCPTDRSNVDGSKVEQITVSNGNHHDLFGVSSLKTKAYDLSAGEVAGLFVTPDKRTAPLVDNDTLVNRQTKCSSTSTGAVFSQNPSQEIVWCAPSSFSCANEKISTGSPSASKNIYTPLHKMHNIHDFQSEIKSKRLFHSSTLDADTKYSRSPLHICGRTGRNTLKLGSFPLNKITRVRCRENGVNDIILRVTSTNAILLRFSMSDGLPLFFCGQSDATQVGHVGKVSEIKSWLIEQNCDASLFSDKWIQNHQKWIVWKLAAIERSFPEELGGNYLVYNRVLRQIKERYDKELRHVRRPAVRKILNRDVSASTPVILCVSRILRFRSNALPKEDVRIELTDGWYALPAALDTVLSQFVQTGKIKVGTKLMICNGQLLGSDEGIDPLDDAYCSSKPDCPVCLSITANSTRLARWNAKLGFVSPRNSQLHSSSILVKSMRDVFIDGGPIPAIDLVICKRYPRMFLEQGVGNQDETSFHLTEAEDAARQIEHETRHQRASERFADMAEKECSEELDDDAPQQWRAMHRSNTPVEYYDMLDAADKKVIDDWTQKRAFLLQAMISKSVEDSMRDDPSTERNSRPYVKLLVRALCRQENSSDKPRSKGISLASELTIWRVSDDQYDLVSEGSVVRMKNLVVKSEDRSGIFQLSANQDTPIEALPNEQTYEKLVRSGYERRCPKSLIQITLMAKQSGVLDIEHEFDVVACIVKVQKVSENTTIAYLTDESGLMVKIKRDHKAENSDPFYLGNVALPAVVAFCNVRFSSFDPSDYCAVGAWGLLTCKSNPSMKARYDYLNVWCSTNDGVDCCKTVLDKINAGIPFGTDRTVKSKVCFGYILCIVEHDNACPASAINIIIDCGGNETVSARCPIDIVQHAIHLFQRAPAENIVVLDSHSSLRYLIHSNKILLRFLLEEMPSYGGEPPILEVTDLSLATIDELSRLYLSKEEGEAAICRPVARKDPNA
eukprot:CCRYP_013006-RA/>CCRYP_013006-RA protein AED:0.02 eAED:0.02 QI:0/0.5/0.33/1/1/1/3/543/2765